MISACILDEMESPAFPRCNNSSSTTLFYTTPYSWHYWTSYPCGRQTVRVCCCLLFSHTKGRRHYGITGFRPCLFPGTSCCTSRRLAERVCKTRNRKTDQQTYCTDTKTVLSWLTMVPRSFYSFVVHGTASKSLCRVTATFFLYEAIHQARCKLDLWCYWKIT